MEYRRSTCESVAPLAGKIEWTPTIPSYGRSDTAYLAIQFGWLYQGMEALDALSTKHGLAEIADF
jgi:hypothetical protein